MISEHLCLSVKDQVGLLLFNRPDRRNALSRQMWEDVPEALDLLASQGARVIVVGGAGACFAAGADLTELSKLSSYAEAARYWGAISSCLDALFTCRLPVIAKIHGACLGGGLLVALACDLRYASSDAVFGMPVARLGIILDEENIQRLVSLVGAGSAKELIFLGSTMTAPKAEATGLVNQAVEPAALDAVVAEQARVLIENAYQSVSMAKQAVNRLQLTGVKHGPDRAVIESYLSEEFRSRARALSTQPTGGSAAL